MKPSRGQWVKELRAQAGGLPGTYWYLWTGTLVNRMGSFVLPFLALYLTRERGFRLEEAGRVVSLHGAGAVLAGIVGGTMSDRLGRRRTLLAGLWLGAGAMLSLGLARTTWHTCVSAFALGLLGELYRPAVSAAIADVVPPRDRARAYGLLYWVINVGYAIALPLAGFASRFGFLALFVADALTSALYGFIVWWKVPETRPADAPEKTLSAPPARSLAAFADPVFVAFALPIMLTALIFSQHQVALPLDLSQRGMSPELFGRVAALNGLLVVLLQPAASQRLGGFKRATVLAWASVLMGLGFGLYGLGTQLPLVVLAVGVWTLGEIAQSPVASTVVADLAPHARRGIYQGAYFTLWALSACVAPTLGSWVLEHLGRTVLWGGCLVLGLLAAGAHLMAAPARRQRMAALRQQGPELSASID
jgi:MFS family permease